MLKSDARPVHTDIGQALGTDYFLLRGTLTESELAYLERTRRFVHEEVLPVINSYWERAEGPLDLCRRLGQLGLVGDGIGGYGCPPMSATRRGWSTWSSIVATAASARSLGCRPASRCARSPCTAAKSRSG